MEKAVNIKLEETTITELTKYYTTATAGAKRATENYMAIYNRFLKSKYRYFTSNEKSLLFDVFNSYLHNPQINSKQSLLANIEDSCNLYNSDKKWEVNQALLIFKIEEYLEETDCSLLLDFISVEWEKGLKLDEIITTYPELENFNDQAIFEKKHYDEMYENMLKEINSN